MRRHVWGPYRRAHQRPASPIPFTIYLSGLFRYVEEKADIRGLSFVDVAWLAEGKTMEEI